MEDAATTAEELPPATGGGDDDDDDDDDDDFDMFGADTEEDVGVFCDGVCCVRDCR